MLDGPAAGRLQASGMNAQSHFQQLLAAALGEPQPQRLLFVFAASELPEDASPAQRERFEQGLGGALTPLMCVDKAPEDLPSFEALCEEAAGAGPSWDIMFAASLAGVDGKPPAKAQIDGALESMIDAIRVGGAGRFAAFAKSGAPLVLG
ncbi:MAG TPA: ribonucleotide reductase subunit alpha [Phenylobacterium sp.]